VNRRPSPALDRGTLFGKDRNRRKPDWMAAGRTVLAVLLVLQGLRVVFTSPRLKLEQVRVSGTARVSPEDVVRIGRIPVGQNMFRVNLVRVSQGLLSNPIFERASVSRELPHTLHVTLQERTPALQVVAAGSALHADRAGVIFERAGAAAAAKLPVLELPEGRRAAIGQKLPADLLRTVHDCLDLAARERLTLRKLRIDAAGELWLNVATPPTEQAAAGALPVRVGRPTELPEKFRDIRQAMAGKPSLVAAAAYLNVMCAGRTAYMQAPEGTSKQ